jgi:hypothetical protein
MQTTPVVRHASILFTVYYWLNNAAMKPLFIVPQVPLKDETLAFVPLV